MEDLYFGSELRDLCVKCLHDFPVEEGITLTQEDVWALGNGNNFEAFDFLCNKCVKELELEKKRKKTEESWERHIKDHPHDFTR